MTATERSLRALLVDTFWGVVVASDPAPMGYYSLSQAFAVGGGKAGHLCIAVSGTGARPGIFLTNTSEKQVQRIAALANSAFWLCPSRFQMFGDSHKTDMSSLEVGQPDTMEDSYFLLCRSASFPMLDMFNPDLRPSGAFYVGWED